ncbi:Hypothetical protein GLP15_4357 [Giardia lamblia P15]|uniref:Uncharacterized protein n=1 Tax=Giardia intestinalis (strain P15) TaxID=658858 RepID=E1F7E5_GIAIA|nr:Hypothetical protein GLP15_4357 [Giardia lamblia P15]
MNNLIIRREQLDGVFMTTESMQTLIDKIEALSSYHFNVIKDYVQRNAITDEEHKALFGTNLNRDLTHRITGYFGGNTIYCAAQLLDPAQRKKCLRYYCNHENYEILDWNANLLDGKSPLKGPSLVFAVKFIEEILGYKTVPKMTYKTDPEGNPLRKPKLKCVPMVGFNNNFQPEVYMDAPNKLDYLRSLTVLQRIQALTWMVRGNYAFREDMLGITNKKGELKKPKKPKKEKKPRKIERSEVFGMRRDVDSTNITIKGVAGAISEEDLKTQPVIEQIQYIYQMVGGSLAGRCNQKLSPDGRVSRADFMAASLNQQTMWLYRQLQGFDEDGDEDNGLRKHLGKYYKIGGNVTAIKSLKKLPKGRISHQTRFLGKHAMKVDSKINRLEKQRKTLEARIKRAEGQIDLIKKKTFTKEDLMKDKMGEFDKMINKGGGLFSKLNLINMIVGYTIDAVILTVATTGLVYAVQAKYRLDDHDKKFKKIYNFLTDDLYKRFQFIWNEFSHINDDVTLTHLEVKRAEERIRNLTNRTDDDRVLLYEVKDRVGTLEGNQDSLMEFRNRMEILMTIVSQFFERNDISIPDFEGGLIDAMTIKKDLEGAYNYLRELIDQQKVEAKVGAQLTAKRMDSLEMQQESSQRSLETQLEEERRRRQILEDRLTSQDDLIRRLSERLDSLELTGGSSSADTERLTARITDLDTRLHTAEQTIRDQATALDTVIESARTINSRFEEFQSSTQESLSSLRSSIAANTSRIDALATTADRVPALETRINSLESNVRGIWDSVLENTNRINDTRSLVTANQTAITSIRNTLSSLQSSLNSHISCYNQLYNQVQTISNNVSQQANKISGALASIAQNTSQLSNQLSRITDCETLCSYSERICNALKTPCLLKSFVPSQTTDGNGFMRLELSSFPSDMQSKSNDYIVSIQPYDCRVSTYSCAFAAWADYSGDGTINVCLKWANASSIAALGSGNRVKVWYWAKNPAINISY